MSSPHARTPAERVVVTSWGMVTSAGATLEKSFAAMRASRSGIGHLTRFSPEGLPCGIAGEVDIEQLSPERPEDVEAGSVWRVLRTTCEQARLAEVLRDLDVPPERVAVSIGGHGETPAMTDIVRAAGYVRDDGTLDAPGLVGDKAYNFRQFRTRLPDEAPYQLAHAHGIEGPIVPVASACAAGTHAIGEGMRMIRAGDADVVLAGGAEPLLSFVYVMGFAILGALSRRYPSPEGASRPFDRKRNGFVIAEGAGVMILTSLKRARERDLPVLGEILGFGSSADCYRITDMHPNGDGALRAMRGALRDARRNTDDVEYINAHGTSTPINDPVETKAIRRLLGERADSVPVSSNKSMIGHTIGAAGAVEALLALRGMQAGVLLPTINQEYRDRRCDLDYVPNEARDYDHRVTLSNSFGFGGQNACLCLGAAPA